MPRYFQSLVPTGRSVVVGERAFTFEPIEPLGGSWLGVLAVDDESTASYIAANGGDEITLEAYDGLKKKRQSQATAHGSVPSQTPRPPPLPMVASASPAAEPRSGSPSEGASGAGGSKSLASITLLTTTKQPPHEPVLELSASTSRRRKAA